MDANNTTYRSVEVSKILRAFSMAHRLACDPNVGDKERKYFRAIAYEIWKACGEQPLMPQNLPAELRVIGDMALTEVISRA